MQKLTAFLIGIQIIGFIAAGINAWLHAKNEPRQIDSVVIFTALLGGAGGVLLSMLLFDRKWRKDNMLTHVAAVCAFIIQLILYIMINGMKDKQWTLSFGTFFAEHTILLIYLAVVNILTLAAFAVDKRKAVRHKPRIRIVTLLMLCFAGGSLGGLCGMYLLRHKTQKDYFTIGVPLMLLMQMALLFFCMNL